MVLGHECAELRRTLLAFQVTALGLAGGAKVAPGQHFAVDKEIVIQNRSRAGQQEWLFGGLAVAARWSFSPSEIVVGSHAQRSSGGLAPFIAQQLAVGVISSSDF